MQMTDLHPAQRQLVHRFIDWNLVEQRLEQFPAIGRAFPIELLRSHQETPPFYCHYMGWRLGTYDETFCARLDQLLTGAEKLPNWCAEKPLLESPEFWSFWSLVWQLQVAEYLGGIGSDVQWAPSSGGPDLSVHIESEKWYVECYTYRKSFDLVIFLQDLLQHVDASICVQYDLCMPFSLPTTEQERSKFLDYALSNFGDPTYIERARSMAINEQPVLLHPQGENSLVVYMEGPDSSAYVSNIVRRRTGDPQTYLKSALNEAARAKQSTNQLVNHRPNLVAVNLSLSEDAFSAFNRADDLKLLIPGVQLGPNLDALAVAMIGIDKRLEWSQFRRIAPTITESVALNKMTCAV